ncbi:MAG: Transcription termination/antitermination protein NusA [Candidatus Magasanikbacteria bacterium]|nr:Transcription termination/antitermination protein NusA [Candidatus Magasanikbacteria bacterium]
MSSPIVQAIKQISEEKNLSYETVMNAIQTALAAAYRKDFGNKNQNIEIEFDPETGAMKATDVKVVVEDVDLEALALEEEAEKKAREEMIARGETPPMPSEDELKERFNPKTDMMITEARTHKADAELGEVLRLSLEIPAEFGRMAAQTAKQVVTQKLREAERQMIHDEFKKREGEIMIGTVQRREGRVVLVDIGRVAGIMLPEDQVPTENYRSGGRLKVLIRAVQLGSKGPEILLSRSAPEIVAKIFTQEIPEIGNGVVEVKRVAREAGARTKIAVWCPDGSVDPIGSCIGQRGTRIQTIIAELGGEKIDVIEWAEDDMQFIKNALSPAKVARVELNVEIKTATVFVVADQFSLAIGKGGQNVRLAAKLTGWVINVQQEGGTEVVSSAETPVEEGAAPVVVEEAPVEKIETQIV